MKNKVIICILCAILVLLSINSIFISCDAHALECNYEECSKCLFIHNIQEILKNIFIITFLAILFIKLRLIKKIILFFNNILYTNLILMNVILNE